MKILPCAFALSCAFAASADIVNLVVNLDGIDAGVVTDGMGSGTVTVDTDAMTMDWDIGYAGTSGPATAAHFHGSALRCESAGVQVGIGTANPAVGSSAISALQLDLLLTGRIYVNIHTAANPGGEIRGQVVPPQNFDPIPTPIGPSAIHVRLETLSTGMTAPNWGTSAPGDSSRLFVTDQSGILWAVDLATGIKTVFLDVSAMLVPLGIFGEGTFDERGLLGVAFNNDYASNGLLYTYTSEPAGSPADFTTLSGAEVADHHAVIREWTVPSPGDPGSVVDPGSARVLLRIDEPQFNHDGGAVNVGADGMLYISLGDGGGADDHNGQPFIGGVPLFGHGCIGNGADPTTILGSVLRIDPSGSNGVNGQYGVPRDNPFLGGPELDEIWAYGFRNPFRFSFDQADGTTMYIADVGQNHLEEISLGVAGGHFGWNAKEGSHEFVANGGASGYAVNAGLTVPAGLIDPIAEYDHDEGIAIIGGFVYRGTKIEPLAGRYTFGEFAVTFSNDGRLFHLTDGNEIVEFQLDGQPALGLSLLGMGQDANGEIYALANATGTPFGDTGVVLRLTTRVGDLNADGLTDFNDLLTLLANWGPCSGCPADINMDGDVGFSDLLALLANWSP